MARRSTEPRKNTNRLGFALPVSGIYRESASQETFKRLACTWLLTYVVLVGAPGPISASQEETRVATAKVDWSVFLPEGEGKAEVSLACASCHDLSQVITQKKSSANWNATVRKMISAYQAPVDKDDLEVIINYLSKNFGEKNPIEHLPMNINTSPIEALARLPGVTLDGAKAIVKSRKTSGSFVAVEDLLRVNGIDAATLKRIKAYIRTQD